MRCLVVTVLMGFFCTALYSPIVAQEAIDWDQVVTPKMDHKRFKNNHIYKKPEDYYLYSMYYHKLKDETRAISYDDVVQGDLGDCYFLARLSAIASTRPTWIKSLITENINGNKFHIKIPTLVKNITAVVTNEFYFYKTEDVEENIYANTDYSSWAALIEKAFAGYYGRYSSIEGGKVDVSSSGLLTGEKEKYLTFGQNQSDKILLEKLHEHLVIRRLPVMLGIPEFTGKLAPIKAPGFDQNHAMALLNIDLNNETLYLYDPHGEEHIISMAMAKSYNAYFKLLYLPQASLSKHLPVAVPEIPTPGDHRTHSARICHRFEGDNPREFTGYEIVMPSQSVISALEHLKSLKVPEKNSLWPFTWSQVVRGLEKRILVTSSIDQSGLPTCGPTLVMNIFLDYKPKEVVDIVAHLFLTGKLRMADGTELSTTQKFRDVKYVGLETRLDDNSANYYALDYMFGSLTNVRSGIPGITSQWAGNYKSGLRSATRIKRVANYLKEFVGFKYVKFVRTSPSQVKKVAEAISKFIEMKKEKVYVGMFRRVFNKNKESINPLFFRAFPNHFVRIKSPFYFGSHKNLFFTDLSSGELLYEDQVNNEEGKVTYVESTHGDQTLKNYDEEYFFKLTYGFIVASDEPIFDEVDGDIPWISIN